MGPAATRARRRRRGCCCGRQPAQLAGLLACSTTVHRRGPDRNATHGTPRTGCTAAACAAGGGAAAAQLQGRQAMLTACIVTVDPKLCVSRGASAQGGSVWKSRSVGTLGRAGWLQEAPMPQLGCQVDEQRCRTVGRACFHAQGSALAHWWPHAGWSSCRAHSATATTIPTAGQTRAAHSDTTSQGCRAALEPPRIGPAAGGQPVAAFKHAPQSVGEPQAAASRGVGRSSAACALRRLSGVYSGSWGVC